jgi:cytochrome c oxidase assembly factor CtaG
VIATHSLTPLELGAAVDTSWTFAPGPIALVLVLGGLYVPRWARVRAGSGAKAAPVWRLLSFLTGLLLLLVALVSPIDALAEQALAMHMTQHVLLLDLVPICLMLGLTRILLRPATRRLRALEAAAGPLAHPVFAVCLYVAVMWFWHVPAFYDSALEDPSVHVLEHVTLLSAGLLYWWHLLSPIRSRLRSGIMGPVVYMLSTKFAVGLLGIGLTFTPDPLYGYYEQRAPIWGMTVAGDQQLAGAIMALEQSIVMGIALAYLFIRALEQSEREQQRRERLEDLREAG